MALYREVVERIRESDTDVIINLTAGMGGDLEIGKGEQPLEFGAGTDLVGPLERLRHVEELLPEICTLDCGTLNFGDGDYIYVSTPAQLRAGARRITELGSRPSWKSSIPATSGSPSRCSRKGCWRIRCSRSAWAFPGARRPIPRP